MPHAVFQQVKPKSPPRSSNVRHMRLIASEPEHLREVLYSRLRESGYRALREVNCQVEFGVVRLSGRLPSFHMKQTAQELLRRVDGVKQVGNELEVTNGLGARN